MELFGIHMNPISITDIMYSLVESVWIVVYLKWIFPSLFKSKDKNN